MRSISNICYCEENGLCLDIHLPECNEFPVFLYFHGGGFVNGSKDDLDILAKFFNDKGIAFAAANYRMYPSARYPLTASNDCRIK